MRTKDSMQSGELFKCKKCKGTGFGVVSQVTCSNCDGTGYVDWIENIVGKKQPELLTAEWEHKIIEEFSKNLAEDIDKKILEDLCGYAGRRKISMQKMQRNWTTTGRAVRQMQGIRVPRLGRQHYRKK